MTARNAKQKVPGWRQPWDAWRILMFAGSLVLLAVAIGNGLTRGSLASWARVGGQVIGYVLLAVGFFLAMRTRRALKQEDERKAAERREARRKARSIAAAEDQPQDQARQD